MTTVRTRDHTRRYLLLHPQLAQVPPDFQEMMRGKSNGISAEFAPRPARSRQQQIADAATEQKNPTHDVPTTPKRGTSLIGSHGDGITDDRRTDKTY